MRIMSYNTLFAGFDGASDLRYRSQLGIIRAAAPDVLLLQEAKGYLASGSTLLFTTEAELGMRGFVAEAPITGQNTAVFVRGGIRPLSFEEDSAHFHHAAAFLRMDVPGLERPLTAVSVHLCPNSPDARRREISYLFNLANPGDLVVVGGDFNSLSPDDPEPDGLHELAPRFRMRYVAADGQADRSTVGDLLRSGFVDVAGRLEAGATPTVPAAGFPDTEFAPFRSDYLLATDAFASTADAYGVIRNPDTDAASDHYPIWADFRIG